MGRANRRANKESHYILPSPALPFLLHSFPPTTITNYDRLRGLHHKHITLSVPEFINLSGSNGLKSRCWQNYVPSAL